MATGERGSFVGGGGKTEGGKGKRLYMYAYKYTFSKQGVNGTGGARSVELRQ